MPHHNQSIRERVIALVEEGNLTAAEAGRRMAFLIELRGGGPSSGIGKLGKLVGALVWDFGVCHPKLRMPGWWTRHGKIHFSIPSS
jgi:hypothetical protein